jgi:hypothetical protein
MKNQIIFVKGNNEYICCVLVFFRVSLKTSHLNPHENQRIFLGGTLPFNSSLTFSSLSSFILIPFLSKFHIKIFTLKRLIEKKGDSQISRHAFSEPICPHGIFSSMREMGNNSMRHNSTLGSIVFAEC